MNFEMFDTKTETFQMFHSGLSDKKNYCESIWQFLKWRTSMKLLLWWFHLKVGIFVERKEEIVSYKK